MAGGRRMHQVKYNPEFKLENAAKSTTIFLIVPIRHIKLTEED